MKLSCRQKDIFLSVWCAITFVGLGTAIMIISSTMFDLADKMGVAIEDILILLTVRSVGNMLGSLTSGVCCDRFRWQSFWLLIVLLTCEFAAIMTVPYSVNLIMLGVLLTFQDCMHGSVNNGVHAVLLRAWHHKSGPSLQLIHCAIAVSFFITPMIAKEFISQGNSDSIVGYTSELLQLNCTYFIEISYNENLTASAAWNLSESCSNWLMDSCADSNIVQTIGDVIHNTSVCNSTITLLDTSRFEWAYLICGFPLLIPIPAFIYYGIKDCCFIEIETNKKVEEEVKVDLTKTENINNAEEENSKKINDSNDTFHPSSRAYNVIVLIGLFHLVAIYVGSETTLLNLFFAYAVKSNAHFSKYNAALLLSIEYGNFALFRFIGVGLLLCKLSVTFLMFTCFSGVIISCLIMIVCSTHSIALWIGGALIGMSMAPIFPLIMTWLSKYAPSNSKATGMVLFASRIGYISISLSASLLIKQYPMILLYMTLTSGVTSLIIFTVLTVIVKVWSGQCSKCRNKNAHARYQKMEIELVNIDELERKPKSAPVLSDHEI